ncbi:hypothetical protein [Arthrobacter sp. Soil763]|uniref:hypothetical protein n=1 Tax=Arthrobacter sp. Soil763 TaxID=1736402 RepID=UPI0006F59BD3|nr:hypothetical protein [Arthrobacter sp. Soil763]KRE79968.1 hypothetical protein ASG71_08000 [Arthrobacter sp. Soil763]
MTTTGMHTEATLKARHQEALDIHAAWLDRYHQTGGTEAAAVEIQMNEAWDWVEQTANDLQLYREVTRHKTRNHGRTAANTSTRLHAHGRH